MNEFQDGGAPDRRRFLGGLVAAGAGAGLVGTRPAPSRPQEADTEAADDTIDVTVLAAAQKIAGLDFSEAELEAAVPVVRQDRARYRAVAATELPQAASPDGIHWLAPEPRAGFVEAAGVRGLTPPEKVPAKEELPFRSVAELAPLLRDRQIRALDLAEACIARLERLDPTLLCMITPTFTLAREQARAADEEIAKGRWRGPLHGIPYGLKDLFAVPGHPTTFGSVLFKDQVLEETAAVYESLRDAGAVHVAKLSLGALAQGDRWFGGRTRNPWAPKSGSSGSSAGSAAAVAARILPFAIGTETLGSIVSPCTRCGASGLRPTFGRVSRHGAMALAWSLDKVGPIAQSVRDLAFVFDAIRGKDPRDPSSVGGTFGFDPERPLEGYRVGYPDDDRSKRQMDRRMGEARGVLEKLGAEIVPVELPPTPSEALWTILRCEAAAAFDAITRDGSIRRMVSQGPRDWPGIFRGARFVPAVELIRISRLRRRLTERWRGVMTELDALMAPPFLPLMPTNFSGHPTVVLPNGFRQRGTPVSITFVGRSMGEGALLEVASRYQEATGHHLKAPGL